MAPRHSAEQPSAVRHLEIKCSVSLSVHSEHCSAKCHFTDCHFA